MAILLRLLTVFGATFGVFLLLLAVFEATFGNFVASFDGFWCNFWRFFLRLLAVYEEIFGDFFAVFGVFCPISAPIFYTNFTLDSKTYIIYNIIIYFIFIFLLFFFTSDLCLPQICVLFNFDEMV